MRLLPFRVSQDHCCSDCDTMPLLHGVRHGQGRFTGRKAESQNLMVSVSLRLTGSVSQWRPLTLAGKAL